VIFFAGKRKQKDVLVTVGVSRSTNGTDFWRTTQTTTAKASSWIGSFSHRAVSVDVHPSSRKAAATTTIIVIIIIITATTAKIHL